MWVEEGVGERRGRRRCTMAEEEEARDWETQEMKVRTGA